MWLFHIIVKLSLYITWKHLHIVELKKIFFIILTLYTWTFTDTQWINIKDMTLIVKSYTHSKYSMCHKNNATSQKRTEISKRLHLEPLYIFFRPTRIRIYYIAIKKALTLLRTSSINLYGALSNWTQNRKGEERHRSSL